MTAQVDGEVEADDGVLLLRRIRVSYALDVPVADEAVVERVHQVHTRACPVYRSICRAIDVTTSYELRRREA